MRVHAKIKGLKSNYLIHKKQQKFQVSFLDWTPYFDWYFAVSAFFVLILICGFLAFMTYQSVISTMNDFENIEVADKPLNVEGYIEIRNEFETREQILNSVR